jgi:hypothetical protein
LPASHLTGPGSIPGQMVWDLWRTKRHWERFSSIFLSTNFSLFIGHPIMALCSVDYQGLISVPVGGSEESHELESAYPLPRIDSNKACSDKTKQDKTRQDKTRHFLESNLLGRQKKSERIHITGRGGP